MIVSLLKATSTRRERPPPRADKDARFRTLRNTVRVPSPMGARNRWHIVEHHVVPVDDFNCHLCIEDARRVPFRCPALYLSSQSSTCQSGERCLIHWASGVCSRQLAEGAISQMQVGVSARLTNLGVYGNASSQFRA